MTDDYTPSMDELRTAWWMHVDNPADNEGESDVSFDRWLAAHDAEVRRVALLEAAQIAEARHRVPVGAGTDGTVYYQTTARFPDDGCRIAAALREEADR